MTKMLNDFAEEGRCGEWTRGGGGSHKRISQKTVQPHPGRQEPKQERRKEEIIYFVTVAILYNISVNVR